MWKPRRIAESSRKEDLEGVGEHQHSSSENEEIERELADVTFEELQKARSDGSHAIFRKSDDDKKGGRANKNRPMEVSSKKPVSRYREVVQTSKKVIRDPRFESLCGPLDAQGFRKRYNFLFESDHPESNLHSDKKKKSMDSKGQKFAEEQNNQLSQQFGFVRIWIIYMLAGLGGSVLSALFIKQNISVGASGALFELLGAMLSELLTNWSIYTNKFLQAAALT